MATTAVRTAADVTVWHSLPALEVARELHVETGAGLPAEEAARRLVEIGPNRFAEAVPEPRRRAFPRQYRDAMQLVLLGAGVGSVAIGELATGLVVLSLTLLNAVLGLQQEGKAAAAVAALQEMLILKARVRRDGELRQ